MPKFIPDQRSSPAPNLSNGGAQTDGANLSELDSLLQDLSAARYGANLEKKNAPKSPSHHILNDSIQRPSVDSLLDELSSAQSAGPIYAIPNG